MKIGVPHNHPTGQLVLSRMAELYLVRHGRATAAWNEDDDPGLDDTGRLQARTVADALKRHRPMGIVSSPLARARETAIPLSEAWGYPVKIEERVGEIPSPVKGLKERGIWLGHVMTKKWPDLPRDLQIWREGVIEALLSFDRDTVVFSHFIAINAAVGKATGDERVVSFWPCNGSISLVRTKSGRLQFIRLGSQGETEVL